MRTPKELEMLAELLSKVGCNTSARYLRMLSSQQLDEAEDWAARGMVKNNDPKIKVPKKPVFLP